MQSLTIILKNPRLLNTGRIFKQPWKFNSPPKDYPCPVIMYIINVYIVNLFVLKLNLASKKNMGTRDQKFANDAKSNRLDYSKIPPQLTLVS